MAEKAQAEVEQQPNQVTLEGLASATLNSKFNVDDGKWKHTLTLAMAVDEQDLEAVRILSQYKGTWYVCLSVEGVQASLPLETASASGAGEGTDPLTQSRIEEAVGQKAG